MAPLKSRFCDVLIPDKISWPEFMFEQFEQYGERTAVVDASSVCSYTFNQLKQMSLNFASGLTKRGLKKGEVLAVALPNSIHYPIIYYGALFVGLTVTTTNPQYKLDELMYQLKDSGAKYLITDLERLPLANRAALQVGLCKVFTLEKVKGFESFPELVQDGADSLPSGPNINSKQDVATLLYSSGTTGLPKGCMLTHYNLVALAAIFGLDNLGYVSTHSVTFAVLPFFHGYAQSVIMGMALSKGSKLVVMQQFEPELFLRTLEYHKVTNAPLVPPLVLFLAKHPLVDKYDLSCLVDVISGGAPCANELVVALRKRLPSIKHIRLGYGLTECVSGTHVSPTFGTKPHSSGLLLPNLECKVIHLQTSAILGANEVGEICVRGPTAMKGYLNKPEATAKTIDKDGWVHTGDVGYYDDEGYFYIVDRIKELIKYKGFQVPPAELEALLISHPYIVDVAVVGVPDVEAGELPKAFVVCRGHVTSQEIMEFVSARVAPHKRLRGGVEFVGMIPKSPSGKILRRVLRQQNILKSKF